jgi:hypothetical protein
MPNLNIELSNREASLVIAALRNWQEDAKTMEMEDLWEAYFENEDPYADSEIDAVCARITAAALAK